MDASVTLLVFMLARQRFAIPASHVVRVVAAAEVTPLPGAPPLVLGIVDLQGEVVPVLDLRQRLGQAARVVGIDDQFLVLRTAHRTIALIVDEARDVVDVALHAVGRLDAVSAEQGQFAGAVRLDEELVLIHDIEKFLQAHEADALDQAMRSAA